MSPKYVLHYWNLPGRVAPIELVFNYAGVDFELKTYTFADGKTIKADDKSFPLGQLPMMEIDGEIFVQSHAILRYLASEFNINGKCNKDRLIIDQALDTFKEINEKLHLAYFWRETVEQKVEDLKKLFGDYVPRAFKMVEGIVQKNGGDYLLGSEISVADIHITAILETIKLEHNLDEYVNFVDGYPTLKRLTERVESIENIKNYMEKRGALKYPFPVKK